MPRRAFDALEVALSLVSTMRPVIEHLRQRDPGLTRQMKDATNSIASNVSEGGRRAGRDRLHSWRVAAGSADEVRTQLKLAVAWGDLPAPLAEQPLGLLDRELAMLWKMTH